VDAYICESEQTNLVLDSLNMDAVVVLLETRCVGVSLESGSIDVSNLSLVSVEDLGDFLEGWALGLDVEDSDEDEFEEDPHLWRISI
jgi:hypothetical protein